MVRKQRKHKRHSLTDLRSADRLLDAKAEDIARKLDFGKKKPQAIRRQTICWLYDSQLKCHHIVFHLGNGAAIDTQGKLHRSAFKQLFRARNYPPGNVRGEIRREIFIAQQKVKLLARRP